MTVRILDAFDEALIAELRQKGEFFWLDLASLDPGQVTSLGELLGLHPLAVEDSISFGQRSKLDTYGDTAQLVLHGAIGIDGEKGGGDLEEIHCYLNGGYIVTLHRNPYAPLDELKSMLVHLGVEKRELYYVYKVIDAVVDSYFPVLAGLDDEINALEDAIVAEADKRQMQVIFGLKRVLMTLRKAVVPMRDVFARESDAIADLAGLEADSHDYLREVYDHLIRIADELESYHEMVSSCTDLYLSTVANRQGEVSKQLTVVASVFLPLTFLTGFFGMNFGWLVDNVLSGFWSFLILGMGTMVLSAGVMWWAFRRKGWTKRDD